MKVVDLFVEINEKSWILIFIVEYLEDDLKYVKLRLIDEFKEYDLWFKNVFYFYYLYLFFDVDYFMVNDEKGVWLNDVYGLVCKFMKVDFLCYEEDWMDVFKFLIVWFEFVMEWLVWLCFCGWFFLEFV